MNYIVLGNKSYININLNEIIDHFSKNVRCNFTIPDNNRGTKIDEQFLNCHVYNFIFDKFSKAKYEEFIKIYYDMYSNSYIDKTTKFLKSNLNNFTNIYNEPDFDIMYKNKIIHFFNENKIEFSKKYVLRSGYNAMLNAIFQNKYKVFVHGFSIEGDSPPLELNENEIHITECHNLKEEQIQYLKTFCLTVLRMN